MNADGAEYCGEVRAAKPQNDDERRKFWADKIKKERNLRHLIADLIEAEFRRVNKGVKITYRIREEIKLDSIRAHGFFYGYCQVLIESNRSDDAYTLPGTIYDWGTNRWGDLLVELGYSNVQQYFKPEHLEMSGIRRQFTIWDNKEKYTVSFNFGVGKGSRFQFDLEKSCIDELEAIRSKSAALTAIMEVKVASSHCPNIKQEEASLEEAANSKDVVTSAFQSQPENCLHGFPPSQELSGVKPFLKLFWSKFVEKEDDDVTLEQRFQVAIDITCIRYWSMWGSDDLQMITSILLHNGTRDTRKGFLPNARAIAAITCFFEQWIAISSNSQCDWYFAKIHELFNADEHTLVNYFRNRIPCSCLDDKHKEVRPIIKMGICCNPQCSLPGRKLERAAMESCEQCRLAHYCSRHCQKKDWKRHKDACLHVSSKVNVRNAQLAQAQSAYDEAFRSSARLQAQLHQMKINMSADSTIDQSTKSGEAGVTQAQTEQRRTAEIKRLENELKMSEARRGQAWKALNLLKTPQVDYSKTLSYEVVDSGIRIY